MDSGEQLIEQWIAQLGTAFSSSNVDAIDEACQSLCDSPSYSEANSCLALRKFTLSLAQPDINLLFRAAMHLSVSVVIAITCDLLDVASSEQLKALLGQLQSHVSTLQTILKENTKLKWGLLITSTSILARTSELLDSEVRGTLLIFLSSILPMADKSALNVKGVSAPLVTQPSTDAQEDVDLQQMNISEDDDVVPVVRDAARYVHFWELQKLLSEGRSVLSDVARWNALLENADAVITALEVSLPARKKRRRKKLKTAGGDTVASSSYSTSTTYPVDVECLLGMFLPSRDENDEFLSQVLLQLVFVFHWIKSSRVKSPPEEEQRKQATAVQKRCMSALTSLSSANASWITQLLAEEDSWHQWKLEGCVVPEINVTEGLEPIHFPPAPLNPRSKLKPGVSQLQRLIRVKDEQQLDAVLSDETRVHGGDVNIYLDQAHEELLPENGIEERYRKSSSAAFSWKLYRLALEQRLAITAKPNLSVKDTTLKDVIDGVYGDADANARKKAQLDGDAAQPESQDEPEDAKEPEDTSVPEQETKRVKLEMSSQEEIEIE